MPHLEPKESQYPITVEINGAGRITVSRHRQIYQNIQLRLEHIGGVDFAWIVICDCPEGFYTEEIRTAIPDCPGNYIHAASKAWLDNWAEVTK